MYQYFTEYGFSSVLITLIKSVLKKIEIRPQKTTFSIPKIRVDRRAFQVSGLGNPDTCVLQIGHAPVNIPD